MDAIEALDDGAYAHFSFVANESPQILDVMRPAYFISTYTGCMVLLLLIVILFSIQRRFRSAWIAAACVAAAIALVESTHMFVPRPRPQDAVKWLGSLAQSGSYPSGNVLVFLLCLILLGNAVWGFISGLWARGLFVVTAALLTVWVCLSQFFLAIHYVTDVIGGIAGASLLGWIAIMFMARGTPPPVDVPSDAIQDLSDSTAIQR